MIGQEILISHSPNRMVSLFSDAVSIDEAEMIAYEATSLAQSRMPRVTGYLAKSLQPSYSINHWGIYFPDKRAWFLERGTNPFTMNSLAGKVIPMWVDDSSGQERKNNPKAKVRVTEDGRTQVLIFRRAARKGERKMVRDSKGNLKSVPKSYPGAPGRINIRSGGGRIGSGNGGVRWRHPGIQPREYINSAMADTALQFGLDPGPFYVVDDSTYQSVVKD